MKHWMPSRPEKPPGGAYLRLSIGGGVALFAAGMMLNTAVCAAVLDRPLFALAGVMLTGSLLIVAALDAVEPAAGGIYARRQGRLLFRRMDGGHRHG